MAKTKALISFAVTAKLICVFVFAYAKSQFSHDEVHLFQVLLLSDRNWRYILNVSSCAANFFVILLPVINFI